MKLANNLSSEGCKWCESHACWLATKRKKRNKKSLSVEEKVICWLKYTGRRPSSTSPPATNWHFPSTDLLRLHPTLSKWRRWAHRGKHGPKKQIGLDLSRSVRLFGSDFWQTHHCFQVDWRENSQIPYHWHRGYKKLTVSTHIDGENLTELEFRLVWTPNTVNSGKSLQ